MAIGIYSESDRRIMQLAVELFSKRHIAMNDIIGGNFKQVCTFKDNRKPKMGPGQQLSSRGEVHSFHDNYF